MKPNGYEATIESAIPMPNPKIIGKSETTYDFN
jgi:hypothetical protein